MKKSVTWHRNLTAEETCCKKGSSVDKPVLLACDRELASPTTENIHDPFSRFLREALHYLLFLFIAEGIFDFLDLSQKIISSRWKAGKFCNLETDVKMKLQDKLAHIYIVVLKVRLWFVVFLSEIFLVICLQRLSQNWDFLTCLPTKGEFIAHVNGNKYWKCSLLYLEPFCSG